MGRVHRWLRLGGGYSAIRYATIPTIAENVILRYISATLLRSVYILLFCTINALKTQKNGRLLYVLLQYIATCRSGALSEAEKYRFMYIICTQKKHTHIFSHCRTSSSR